MNDAINIELCGESVNWDELRIRARNQDFLITADEKLKHSREFLLGIFSTKSVLSNEAFRYPRCQRVALLSESPIDPVYQHLAEVVKRFPLIFTHQKDLYQRGLPFRRLMLGTNWVSANDQYSTERISALKFEKTRLISFIGSVEHPDSGAYALRRVVSDYLLRTRSADCFGKGIRHIAGKREALEPYMFSVAMENASSDFYFSEKLVDCLLMQAIPIYFGSPNISQLFDLRGILQFKDLEELKLLISDLTPARYEEMMPFVRANRDLVIENGWHNHAGLITRLIERLPDSILSCAPIRHSSTSFMAKIARRARQVSASIRTY